MLLQKGFQFKLDTVIHTTQKIVLNFQEQGYTKQTTRKVSTL